MTTASPKSQACLRRDESGAAFILFTIMMPVILAMSAFAVDIGYVYYVKTRLQTAADMGALAGASILYTRDEDAVKQLAEDYAAMNLPAKWSSGTTTSVTATPEAEVACLDTVSDMGLTCESTSGGNALKVRVEASTPLFFASALGFKTIPLSADAVVTGGGSSPPPLNVAIVIDMTGSMNSKMSTGCGTLPSTSNGPTRVQCAMLAAKSLLAKLWPSIDQVALYAYPAVAPASAKVLTCSNKKGDPAYDNVSYRTSDSAHYQLIDFSTNYRDSGSPPVGGLDTETDIVKMLGKAASSDTAGDDTTCAGLDQGDKLGGQGTYFADAIQQAREDLLDANQRLDDDQLPQRQNVLIILSDGDANGNIRIIKDRYGNILDTYFETGTDSSAWTIDVDRQMSQCQRAVGTANDARDIDGIWVYSVAFGAEYTDGSSCFSDLPVDSVTNTAGPFTDVILNTRTCSNKNPCKNIAAAPMTRSTVAAVKSSKQVATTTTGTVKTTCLDSNNKDADGKKSGTCKTILTPTKIQTDTYTKGSPLITACGAMRSMASDPSKFYSTDGNSKCSSSANPNFTDLVAIFNNVAASIMKKRRIPNGTT